MALISRQCYNRGLLCDLMQSKKEDDSALASTQNGSARRADFSALNRGRHLLSDVTISQNFFAIKKQAMPAVTLLQR